MKKLVLMALLLLAGRGAFAQTASLKIINHTDFDVDVTMYADAPSSCGAGCSSTYVTNIISLATPGTVLSGQHDLGTE